MASTKTSFLLLYALAIFLTLNQVFGDDLIQQTCNKTDYYDLCISILKSAPRNPIDDLDEFANIFINASMSSSHKLILRMNRFIHNTTNKEEVDLLRKCAFDYNKALNCFDDAKLALATRHYDQVYQLVGVAKDQGLVCEGRLKSVMKLSESVLVQMSEVCVHLFSIEQSVVKLIH